MELSTIWWLMAGIAVIAELLTGTLYLLMVAVGLAAGAIAAHLGASATVQILVAAVISIATLLACYLRQKKRGGMLGANGNHDMQLDVGELVTVEHWSAERTAQVRYRGSPWTAYLQGNHSAHSGTYRVVAVDGTRLRLEPAEQPS